MEETVTLTTVKGVLTIKDELKDYVDRGPELAHYSLLDFFLNTYDGDFALPSTSNRGQTLNKRVRYLENTGHGKKCRILRLAGHETMPNFVGNWFPRNDVEEVPEIYHASMLVLLTPWREIGELKSTNESFANAFARFVFAADDRVKDIMANIQYQHECSDGARRKRDQERRQKGTIDIDGYNTQGVVEPSTQTIRNENLVDNRVEDIILDPREHVSRGDLHDDDNGIIWLKYPPAMIVFKPLHYEFPPFPGMDPGLIPIFPSEVTFNIHYQNNPKTKITRRQYPLSAAYAFTDHKAQGQTIENVIVDIGTTK